MKKGFIDLFVVREDNISQSASNGVVAGSQIETISNEAFTQQAVKAPTIVAASSNTNIVSQLWDAVISKNLPGPDYLELKNNVSALDELPISESQKIEAAFKVLKKSYPELTKTIILNSIDTYINIVNDEKKHGLSECDELEKKTIGEKQSRVNQLKETAQNIQKQIAELEAQLNSTNNSISKLSEEIITDNAEITSKKNTFIASVDTVLSVLNEDKNKISTINI